MEKIIVGIDGSDTAERALSWALAHASADDTIVVATAWVIPAIVGLDVPMANLADYEVAAHRLVKETAVELKVPEDGPTIETAVVAGHAGPAMSKLSADADLIVVGSRGFGEMKSLLLGSASNYIVHHAQCPVVVVPRAEASDE